MIRLMVGLVQGVLLSMLTVALIQHVAPFQRPAIALPLGQLLSALPVSFLLVWGRMRGRSIAILLGVLAAITLAITLHEADQGLSAEPLAFATPLYRQLFKPLLFILLALALAAEQDRRPWPSYPRLFETAWDLAILLLLAGLFVALSWGVLWLMAGLFTVVGFHGLFRLLIEVWVWPLVSCVAVAAAIAFSVEGDRLVTAARRLALALFGLLLPILGGLAAVFLVSLAFVPISRLWTSHHAGLLLSLSALLLILLLNAVYQDGRTPGAVMRLSGRLAAIEILPLAVLAMTALALRVHDHGWSIERVVAAGGFSILGVYGVGYLVAALLPGRWLRGLEPVNVGAAIVAVLVIVSLLTPIADPARISVANQVARLRGGLVSADGFDYAFLADGSGRYGRDALASLVKRPPPDGATIVRDRAATALASAPRPSGPPSPSEVATAIRVHPAGSVLPDGLLSYATGTTDPTPWLACLHVRGQRCDAVVLPVTPDAQQHVAFLQDRYNLVALFDRTARGWQFGGTLDIGPACIRARMDLLAGRVTLGSVAQPVLVLPAGQFRITPPDAGPNGSCSN